MKDLVLEAVKAFPVWPEGAVTIIRNKNTSDFDWSHCNQEELGGYGSAWCVACTREQHIRKRVGLFEGAPEGAEFMFLGDKQGAQVCYYKNIKGGYCQFFYKNYINWSEKNRAPECYPLVPRPTQEELAYIAEIESKNKALDDVTDTDVGEWNGEGLPPVGTVCEYYDAIPKTWRTIAIVAHHINGEEAIWSESIEGGQLFYGTPSDFRPLKTEAEKERERLFKKVLDAINPDGMTYYDVDTVGDFISDLIDKGLIK